MKVVITSPLRSYTKDREVDAAGETLAALLIDLDRQYTGIRFSMVDEQGQVRPHMRIFVNGEQVFDLTQTLGAADEVQIVQALSGG
jgi:molybdopterin converting factor small subunit